jgi:hypothetical protein
VRVLFPEGERVKRKPTLRPQTWAELAHALEEHRQGRARTVVIPTKLLTELCRRMDETTEESE